MKKVVIAVVAAGLLSAAGTALAKPGNGQKDATIRTAELFSASIRSLLRAQTGKPYRRPPSAGSLWAEEWYNYIQHSIINKEK